MIHKMKLWREPFSMIKNGKKDIELRLNDEKRQKIKVGDTIVFISNISEEEVRCEVVNLHYYDSFEELYKHFDKERLGYRENEVPNFNDMGKFYLKDEINRYGVVGIEIKKIEE